MDNIEIDDFDESFNSGTWGSGNTETTTTTTTLGLAADSSFNTDDSTNDSGNVVVDVADSFNEDSNDTTTDISDSWNDDSDNSMTDNSDNSATTTPTTR